MECTYRGKNFEVNSSGVELAGQPMVAQLGTVSPGLILKQLGDKLHNINKPSHQDNHRSGIPRIASHEISLDLLSHLRRFSQLLLACETSDIALHRAPSHAMIILP